VNALVFGITGQDGFYLGNLLGRQGINVVGVSRSDSGGRWIVGDLAKSEQVEALVRKHQPDYIFHLAANSTTQHDALFENYETISTGTLNVLESMRRHRPDCRVFLCGSGLQFVNRGQPISENDDFEATSAYSLARIQSVYAGRYYRTLGLRVYVGYLFHHDSPLRKANHVSKMIALAAQRIAAGSTEVLEMGDITVRKEWGFAGDIAAGMLALVNQETVFEAAIGTGVTYTIENWLERCFQQVGRNWRDHVRLREEFVPEYRSLVSDPATIRALGWSPTVSFEALAEMMVIKSPTL
jgi:GDPmannose 4,6-dehydratase